MGRTARNGAGRCLRWTVMSLAASGALTATALGWVTAGAPAAAAPQTVVTIQFDDGTTDQIDALPILQAHGMVATFFVNSGPVLAGDPTHMTVAQLTDLFNAGNEIAGHTVDHVNIQPLATAEARAQVCDDRDNLLAMGFPVTSFAYPFGSYDGASEDVVHYCGYNSGRTVSGISLKKPPAGESLPPLDPYATRTPPDTKKSTKLSTLEQYVLNAEAGVQSGGSSLWLQFTFHHLCSAHCGAYNITPAKFTAFLDFLQAQEANGVVVETTAQAVGGPVNPPCDPATGTGCVTSPR
jgi:peptidoglycan/xylan/chitin deacetylase (PgdA/CDA1 family)